MNLIINSLKESFALIKKNKTLFMALLLIQLIFFSVFFSIQLVYWTKIMDSSLEVINYLSEQNLDETAVGEALLLQEDILGEDPLMFYRNLQSVAANFLILSLLSILCFIIFEGTLWAVTDNLINKKKLKQFFLYIKKFAFLTIIYGAVMLVLLFLSLKTLSQAIVATLLTFIIFIIMVLFVVFIFSSYALIGKNNIKDIVKKTFFTIKNNLITVLVSFLMVLVVIAVFSYFIILIQELPFILTFIAIIAFVSSFVFCRIFLYVVMNGLKS